MLNVPDDTREEPGLKGGNQRGYYHISLKSVTFASPLVLLESHLHLFHFIETFQCYWQCALVWPLVVKYRKVITSSMA